MGGKHSSYCSSCSCLNCRVCNSTIEECINFFNNDVGNSGWVNARGRFHELLREKFQNSNYDCSGFIKRKELPSGKLILTTNMSKKIRIEGMKIVQIND
tara:strand:+ start:203 stop:499 length:297 start_codon:yes stop_codon:yes gene_type:complete